MTAATTPRRKKVKPADEDGWANRSVPVSIVADGGEFSSRDFWDGRALPHLAIPAPPPLCSSLVRPVLRRRGETPLCSPCGSLAAGASRWAPTGPAGRRQLRHLLPSWHGGLSRGLHPRRLRADRRDRPCTSGALFSQPHRRPLGTSSSPGLPPAFRLRLPAAVDGPRSPGHCYDANTVLPRPGRHRPVQRRPLGPVPRAGEGKLLQPPQRLLPTALPLAGGRPAPDAARGLRRLRDARVRGFTCHPSSLAAHPGTFAGLIEKMLPYSCNPSASRPSSCSPFTSSTRRIVRSTSTPSTAKSEPQPLGLKQQHRPSGLVKASRTPARVPWNTASSSRVPRDGAGLPRGRDRGVS